jgi:hypothetical protein
VHNRVVGDAELVLGAEIVPEVWASAVAGEELLGGGEGFGGFGFCFFDEVNLLVVEVLMALSGVLPFAFF